MRRNVGNLGLPARLGIPWISESETQLGSPVGGQFAIGDNRRRRCGHLLVFQKDEWLRKFLLASNVRVCLTTARKESRLE